MTRRRTTARRRALVLLGLVVVAGVTAPVAARTDPGPAALLSVVTWFDGFVHGPGLGGAAAVGAACVALGQWWRQERARGEAAEAARGALRDRHWWETYHLLRAEAPRATYADRALVRVLARTAETEIQTAAASSLVVALRTHRPLEHQKGHRDVDTPAPPGPPPGS